MSTEKDMLSACSTPSALSMTREDLKNIYGALGMDPKDLDKVAPKYKESKGIPSTVNWKGKAVHYEPPPVSTPTRAPLVTPLNEFTEVRVKNDTEYWLSKFITEDVDMLAMKDVVRKLAPTKHAVLIQGETGTGKELIARALHGKERLGRFVSVNCGGFPEHLIESELFGHVKGAFTGAERDKPGLFHAAENGTLFLDEIGELPVLMQTKLLRVIQERTVRRVGATTEEYVNARIVAATHKDIVAIRALFREDLYWRLSTFVVRLSALRDRPDDIPLILKSLGIVNDIPVTFSKDELTERILVGNVRELQRIALRKQVLG